MQNITRRGLGALTATALSLPYLARAADWPTRPVTLLVPYPPGGPSDVSARPLLEPLSRLLGQPVVIENRAGAGGSIGAQAVAQSRDGHTVMIFPTAVLTISPHVMAQLPYDPATAFIPVARITLGYSVIASHPSLPFRDAAGLIAYGKANPGQLRFGSAGPGTITQLTGELFGDVTGIRLEHVPYRGSAPSLTDALAGRVQLLFDSVAVPAVNDGKLIGIATIGENRNPSLPNVPTLAEIGLERALAIPWFGVAAPASMPPAAVARLTEAL
ncbi:MAG: Bug family tripartite tricarboxylate transporter substrate binding protein, partial [Alphaproteobacteria bacterium]